MSNVKPWVRGPLELLRHAEDHLKGSKPSDSDRRMALISFDNAIEVSITTFLQLNPSQRNNLAYPKEDVQKWLHDYHSRLDFLFEFLRKSGKPIEVQRDVIIWYHGLRNELYHSGNGLVPEESSIAGIREVAHWVLSVLFDISTDALLAQNPLVSTPTPLAQEDVVSPLSVLGEFIKLRKDINLLLRMAGIVSPDDSTELDPRQAWNRLRTQYDTLPVSPPQAIDKVETIRDAIVTGQQMPQETEELRELTRDLEKITAFIDNELRKHQREIANNAVDATVRAAAPGGNRRAGVCIQAVGSGRSMSILAYAALASQHPELGHPIIVVVTAGIDLAHQLHFRFVAHSQRLGLHPFLPKSIAHLHELLNRNDPEMVIIVNEQKFRVTTAPLTNRSDMIVVADDISSPNTMRHLMEALPSATRILFASTLGDLVATKRTFGDVIQVYGIQQAIAEGESLPVYVEQRALNLGPNSREWQEAKTRMEDAQRQIGKHDQQAAKRVEEILSSADYQRALAQDVANHFGLRTRDTDGKALVLVYSRALAMGLYEQIMLLRPEWEAGGTEAGVVEVVVTGEPSDPPVWQPYFKTERQLQEVLARFRTPGNAPKLLISGSDLLLTGLDAPSLDTLYIDRPLSRQILVQAIAGVARPAPSKPHGLVVDYWGLSSEIGAIAEGTLLWTDPLSDGQ